MNIIVSYGPSYAVATAMLHAEERVIAEVGAMVSMDPHVVISTQSTERLTKRERRGCIGWLLTPFRRIIGADAFYQNHFSSVGRPGSVTFAPSVPGDVAVTDVRPGVGLILQSTSFLCGSDTLSLDPKWEGARKFVKGDGIFMVQATGEGVVAFSSFGAIREVQVEDHYVVDSGHLVAFEDTLQYDIRRFSRGIFTSMFGGESMVCEFGGSGKVWIQSRNTKAWGDLIGPRLPKRMR